MRLPLVGVAVGLLSSSAIVTAQTFTDCNPLQTSELYLSKTVVPPQNSDLSKKLALLIPLWEDQSRTTSPKVLPPTSNQLETPPTIAMVLLSV